MDWCQLNLEIQEQREKVMKHKKTLFFHFFKKKINHGKRKFLGIIFVACFGYVFLASSLSNKFVYDYENKYEKTAQVWKIINWRSFLPKKEQQLNNIN